MRSIGGALLLLAVCLGTSGVWAKPSFQIFQDVWADLGDGANRIAEGLRTATQDGAAIGKDLLENLDNTKGKFLGDVNQLGEDLSNALSESLSQGLKDLSQTLTGSINGFKGKVASERNPIKRAALSNGLAALEELSSVAKQLESGISNVDLKLGERINAQLKGTLDGLLDWGKEQLDRVEKETDGAGVAEANELIAQFIGQTTQRVLAVIEELEVRKTLFVQKLNDKVSEHVGCVKDLVDAMDRCVRLTSLAGLTSCRALVEEAVENLRGARSELEELLNQGKDLLKAGLNATGSYATLAGKLAQDKLNFDKSFNDIIDRFRNTTAAPIAESDETSSDDSSESSDDSDGSFDLSIFGDLVSKLSESSKSLFEKLANSSKGGKDILESLHDSKGEFLSDVAKLGKELSAAISDTLITNLGELSGKILDLEGRISQEKNAIKRRALDKGLSALKELNSKALEVKSSIFDVGKKLSDDLGDKVSSAVDGLLEWGEKQLERANNKTDGAGLERATKIIQRVIEGSTQKLVGALRDLEIKKSLLDQQLLKKLSNIKKDTAGLALEMTQCLSGPISAARCALKINELVGKVKRGQAGLRLLLRKSKNIIEDSLAAGKKIAEILKQIIKDKIEAEEELDESEESTDCSGESSDSSDGGSEAASTESDEGAAEGSTESNGSSGGSGEGTAEGSTGSDGSSGGLDDGSSGSDGSSGGSDGASTEADGGQAEGSTDSDGSSGVSSDGSSDSDGASEGSDGASTESDEGAAEGSSGSDGSSGGTDEAITDSDGEDSEGSTGSDESSGGSDGASTEADGGVTEESSGSDGSSGSSDDGSSGSDGSSGGSDEAITDSDGGQAEGSTESDESSGVSSDGSSDSDGSDGASGGSDAASTESDGEAAGESTASDGSSGGSSDSDGSSGDADGGSTGSESDGESSGSEDNIFGDVLSKLSERSRNLFEKLLNSTKDGVSLGKDILENLSESKGQFLSDFAQLGKELSAAISDGLISNLGNLSDTLTGKILDLQDKISQEKSALKRRALNKGLSALKELNSKALELKSSLQDVGNKVAEEVGDKVSSAVDGLVAWGAQQLERVNNQTNGSANDEANKIIKGLIDRSTQSFVDALRDLEVKKGQLDQQLLGKLSNFKQDAAELVQEITECLSGPVSAARCAANISGLAGKVGLAQAGLESLLTKSKAVAEAGLSASKTVDSFLKQLAKDKLTCEKILDAVIEDHATESGDGSVNASAGVSAGGSSNGGGGSGATSNGSGSVSGGGSSSSSKDSSIFGKIEEAGNGLFGKLRRSKRSDGTSSESSGSASSSETAETNSTVLSSTLTEGLTASTKLLDGNITELTTSIESQTNGTKKTALENGLKALNNLKTNADALSTLLTTINTNITEDPSGKADTAIENLNTWADEQTDRLNTSANAAGLKQGSSQIRLVVARNSQNLRSTKQIFEQQTSQFERQVQVQISSYTQYSRDLVKQMKLCLAGSLTAARCSNNIGMAAVRVNNAPNNLNNLQKQGTGLVKAAGNSAKNVALYVTRAETDQKKCESNIDQIIINNPTTTTAATTTAASTEASSTSSEGSEAGSDDTDGGK